MFILSQRVMAVKITGLVIVLENWKSIVCLEIKGRYNLPFQKPLKVVLEQKCVSQTCNGWSNEGTLKLKYEQHRHHEIRTLVIKLFMHRKHCLNKYLELDALLNVCTLFKLCTTNSNDVHFFRLIAVLLKFYLSLSKTSILH